MKCLIIADVLGTRVSTKGESRRPVTLAGLSLIERVILTAMNAGLTDFYVATGSGSEDVRDILDILSLSRDINITHIANENWEKEKDLLDENFILLMGDHIFDESILRKLRDEKIVRDEVILAVNYNIKENKFVDINNTNKVLVKDNRILQTGKNIREYNAYGTGICLCSPAIFSVMEAKISDGNEYFARAIGIMAQKKKVRAMDIENAYWLPVYTKKDQRKAARLLLRESVKPAGPITRYINATFATMIFTPLLLKINKGFTPNQVSFLSFIVALLSSLFFILGHAVIGALLIQVSSILDYSDGQFARLKYMASRFGHFTDITLDRYADGFILLGMFYYSLSAIGGKTIGGIYWSLLLISIISIIAIVGNLMVSYTSATSVVNFGYVYKRKGIAAGRGRDIRLFLLFMGGIMSIIHPIFVLFALLVIAIQTNIIVICRVILSRNYFNKESTFRMINRTEAIIFDFDGTVADTMPFLTELAVNLITENYDISKEEAKRRYLETTGLDFASQLESIFSNHPNNQRVASDFEKRKLEGIFNNPVFPDVISTLKYFGNKKIKTFICSSTKQKIITKYSRLNKIDTLIGKFFGYEPNFKKGEQIDYILQHYELQPEKVVFVADSLRDCDFAKEKKINFVGVLNTFEKKAFEKKGAISVESLTDLTKFFETSEEYLKYVEQV
ncbi:MAG: HAD hydrolase-like protein [Deltaproteobacteria bacterium]|nr:HAD hydrolase-like protein [Deltaproteobacteria bacterium]